MKKKSVRVLYRKALQHKDAAKQGMTGKNVSKMLSFDENSTYTRRGISLSMLGILISAGFMKTFSKTKTHKIFILLLNLFHVTLYFLLNGLCLMLIWSRHAQHTAREPNVAYRSFQFVPLSPKFCAFTVACFLDNCALWIGKNIWFWPLGVWPKFCLAHHEIWVVHPCCAEPEKLHANIFLCQERIYYPYFSSVKKEMPFK